MHTFSIIFLVKKHHVCSYYLFLKHKTDEERWNYEGWNFCKLLPNQTWHNNKLKPSEKMLAWIVFLSNKIHTIFSRWVKDPVLNNKKNRKIWMWCLQQSIQKERKYWEPWCKKANLKENYSENWRPKELESEYLNVMLARISSKRLQV